MEVIKVESFYVQVCGDGEQELVSNFYIRGKCFASQEEAEFYGKALGITNFDFNYTD